MDIKSNGIKYSYGMKVIAFLLATAFVLSSAWCCAEITKMLHDFGWENLLVRENAGFTDTLMFYNEFSTAAWRVKNGPLAHTWEEECAENYGTLEEEQQRALEQFRAFKASAEKEAGKLYVYDGAETDTAETTTNAAGLAEAYDHSDNVQAYLLTSNMPYTFKYFESVTITLDYTMSEEEVAETVETVYNQNLAAAKRSFESDAVIAKERVSGYTNFYYLARSSQTGEVFTNSDATTPDAFYALFDSEDWVLGFTAEQGMVYYSDAVAVDTLYNTQVQSIGYKCLPDYLGEAFGDAGWDIYLCAVMPAEYGDAFYTASLNFYNTSAQLETLLLAAVILLGLALLLSIYLVLVTGRVRDREGVQLSALDKLPTDVHFVLSWGLACIGFTGAASLLDIYVFDNAATYYIRNVSLLCLGIALICAAVYAVLMEWFTSIAKLAKVKGSFVRSMLLVKFALWLWKMWKRFLQWAKKSVAKAKNTVQYKAKHLSKKAWVFAAVYVGANVILALILATSSGSLFALLCIAAVNILALVVLWKHLIALDKIIDAAEKSKTGEMPQDIGADAMPEPLRGLAKNLTFTQEEMQKAVSEAVKGERMKTELITNVSHDLKTPLTSIISYVDLLKKCDIDDIDAQKYITVLDEKSIRLKRLIEDLVEASKASSGAVTLNKMYVNLYELAVQAIGEMEESFQEQNLQIVLNKEPENAPVVFADSQKTWRVIDNLLNNARKYSMKGSRVYVQVSAQDGNGVFVIKNMSCEALNMDPDELTQRFVRGDQSRTQEGSGLGLSIAKDLCTLQGGSLKIEIDGDLFKATVALPLAPAAPQTAEPQTERQA